MEESWFRAVVGGFQIRLHIQPAAKKSEVIGLHGARIKIKIKVPLKPVTAVI